MTAKQGRSFNLFIYFKQTVRIFTLISTAIAFFFTAHSQVPYPTEPNLSPYSSYYKTDLSTFDRFLNGVWEDIYNWDSGTEVRDNTGAVIGGWKPIIRDNLIFNHYTEYGGSWEGFCVSNRDFVYSKPDPLNQFTATTLGGKDGPGTPYMIAYYGWGRPHDNACHIQLNDGLPCGIAGMYVTNTYYNYLSLLIGDGFARPFIKGDWFLLTAYAYDAMGQYSGTTEFYLADYRSENPDDHYIIDDWRWFDLSSLGQVTSLEFVLTSSDNAVYGMNTPSYFCMDKLTLSLLEVDKQPKETKVCPGDTARLSVNVLGNDFYNTARKDYVPRLQWRKDGVDIPGANDTLLVISDVKSSDAAQYNCYATSDYYTQLYGSYTNDQSYKTEVLSATALISLKAPVSILAHPDSVDIQVSESTALTVKANGDDLSYQWYKDEQVLENDTNPVLYISNATIEQSGKYYCKVTGVCNTLSTSIALVHVKELPPTILNLLTDTLICEGTKLILHVKAQGTDLKYQWYNNSQALQGETQPSFTSEQAGNYSCKVSNNTGFVVSNSAIVTIAPNTTIVTEPMSQKIPERQSVGFELKARGENLNYQWYKADELLPDATQPIYIKDNLQADDAGSYYCKVSGKCGTVQSQRALLTITISPAIYPNPFTLGFDELKLKGYANYIILVNDIYGKHVDTWYVQSDLQTFLPPYAVGVYLLSATHPEGENQLIKLIIH